MKNDYFKRVYELTGTKFWINNVTREEARMAIESGATGCTQNPSYTLKMINHPAESDFARTLMKEAIRESDNDNEVVCILQRKLVKGVSDIFLPLHHRSNGKYGYVSIQGDPINEEDPEVILREGRLNRGMNPNVMIKIPATKAGLQAMEILIAEETPINATEVMGLSQALEICRMYRKISVSTGKYPPIYYSLITGIYDEYLTKWIHKEGIEISNDILSTAGIIIARKVHKVTKTHYPEIGFIGGGVRGLHHFTEMVGADVCITMNWEGQAEELLKLDYPVVPRFYNQTPDLYLDELLTKVTEFQRAYYENGLSVDEYEHFGPVDYFRQMFISAWKGAVKEISNSR